MIRSPTVISGAAPEKGHDPGSGAGGGGGKSSGGLACGGAVIRRPGSRGVIAAVGRHIRKGSLTDLQMRPGRGAGAILYL